MMNNEEFERKMAFIVEQQAQFATDIQQLGEVQGQLQATQVQTENVVARLANATLEGFKDVNEKIDTLVDAQIRLNESQAHTDENLARTDENLRNLIAVVDRYFSEGRNGK
jgi:ABC-type transporter Mla subunit MlaD